MDDCRGYFATLSDYLDGDLSPEQCVKMEQHLAGCGPCVEFVESLRQAIALCRETADPAIQVPESSKEELREAYRRSLEAMGKTV